MVTNRNNTINKAEEIDLKEVLLILWKSKFFFLIITSMFMAIGFLYSFSQPKLYQSTITVREAHDEIFYIYDKIFNKDKNKESYADKFNKDFQLNLLSLDNLEAFIKQNKKLDTLNSYLKENKKDVRKLFYNKLLPLVDKVNKGQNQYILTYPKSLLYENFLNDYVIYIGKITEKNFKLKFDYIFLSEMKIVDNNLIIAQKINIENPIDNKSGDLFYEGYKVLSQKKSFLKELMSEEKNIFLNYNPILEKALVLELKPFSKSPVLIMVVSFIAGFFFSIIYAIIRNVLKTS